MHIVCAVCWFVRLLLCVDNEIKAPLAWNNCENSYLFSYRPQNGTSIHTQNENAYTGETIAEEARESSGAEQSRVKHIRKSRSQYMLNRIFTLPNRKQTYFEFYLHNAKCTWNVLTKLKSNWSSLHSVPFRFAFATAFTSQPNKAISTKTKS